MDISVIVTTYNRAAMLAGTLQSLQVQQGREHFTFEIIVVDNASTDDTREVVESIAAHAAIPMRYVLETRQGVACARNRGLRETRADWVAFFDDDQIAEADWLRQLFAVAAAKQAACVGGKVLLRFPVAPVQLDPICRQILGESAFGNRPHPYPGKFLPGTGNVLLCRRAVEAVGLFDESFAYGSEDTEFFRRMRRGGHTLWYAPLAVAHHLIPAHRLSTSYFFWASLRQGVNYAALDYREQGLGKLALYCSGRVAKSFGVTLPRLMWAALRNRETERIGAACLLWRTCGYLRKSLNLLSPRLFSQRRFFERLEFRKEKASVACGSS